MTVSIPEVPDLSAAFNVETTLALVDHEGLGIVVSELTSDQQADFLTGLADGFSRFDNGAARGLQLAYIAAAFKESPAVVAQGVWALLHDLAEHLAEVIEP
jgi:hypothetical protein